MVPAGPPAGEGQPKAEGVEHDVALKVSGAEMAEVIIAAHHEKYDRYGASIVGTVTAQGSAPSTLSRPALDDNGRLW